MFRVVIKLEVSRLWRVTFEWFEIMSIHASCYQSSRPEETFGSVGFESLFKHLEIISNERPITVCNGNIDISKSSSLKRNKFFTC